MKPRKGLSFFEVMIAAAAMSSGLLAIFSLQQKMRLSAYKGNTAFYDTMSLKNFWYKAQLAKKITPQEYSDEKERVSLALALVERSSLSRYNGVQRVMLTGIWEDVQGPLKRELFTFLYAPKDQDKE